MKYRGSNIVATGLAFFVLSASHAYAGFRLPFDVNSCEGSGGLSTRFVGGKKVTFSTEKLQRLPHCYRSGGLHTCRHMLTANQFHAIQRAEKQK